MNRSRATVDRGRTGKYRRARLRNFVFTHGPNRLSGGRIVRSHLSKGVVLRDVEVASPLWPRDFDGMRIAHVSDFHLGELLPVDDAVRIVRSLRDQEPDFVACTGDVVDLHNDDAAPLLRALAGLDAPFGTALVLGNHDELHDPDELARIATESGVLVLRNEAFEINHNGGRLLVAGTEWARSVPLCSRNVDVACGHFAHLLLSHNPKSFLRAATLGIPLTLAGHTHGGQVAMKNRPRANLALTRRAAGLYAKGMSRLFVTSGVGAWFPLRINCPAEVAMITMRHGDEPAPPRRRRKRRL